MDIKLSKGFYYLVLTAMILFFIADAANKYLDVYSTGLSLSIYIRFLFELLFIASTILILKKSILELYLSLGILFLCFSIGQAILLYNNYEDWGDFFVNVKIFNKYIFFFVLYPVVEYILDKNSTLLNKLVNAFYFLFLMNIIISFFGFLAESELVRSYPLRERFGYSGLIPKRNEATLFYLLGLTIAYVRFILLRKKERILFFLSLLGCIMLGTKGIYIFLIFLFLFHIRTNKKLVKRLFISGFLLIFLGVLIIPQTQVYNYYHSQAQRIGILTMLLSGRDIIFYDEITTITDNWNFINILFGGQNQNDKAFEMDFFDLFFFFGFIGSFLYIELMTKLFFKVKDNISFQHFFIWSYFFIAFFGGHFFSSAVNSLYFVIIVLYIFKSGLIKEKSSIS